MRRLLLVETGQHDRRESRQQQRAGGIELVGIARAHQVDALLQFRALCGSSTGAGSAGNGDRRQARTLALDARRLVLLEVDVDEHRVFGLERLLGRRAAQPRRARRDRWSRPSAVARIALAFAAGAADVALVDDRAAEPELLHQRFAVLGTHAAQELELFGGWNLRRQLARSRQHQHRSTRTNNPLTHQNPCCQITKPCTPEDESAGRRGSS